jgi:hypothetical protein
LYAFAAATGAALEEAAGGCVGAGAAVGEAQPTTAMRAANNTKNNRAFENFIVLLLFGSLV